MEVPLLDLTARSEAVHCRGDHIRMREAEEVPRLVREDVDEIDLIAFASRIGADRIGDEVFVDEEIAIEDFPRLDGIPNDGHRKGCRVVALFFEVIDEGDGVGVRTVEIEARVLATRGGVVQSDVECGEPATTVDFHPRPEASLDRRPNAGWIEIDRKSVV